MPLATDAQVIDLAGRQRMLNQRLMKEVLARLLGLDADYDVTLRVLRQTGSALVSGGDAAQTPGQPPSLTLSPAPTAAIGSQLGLLTDLLDGLEEAGRRLLSKRLGDADLAEFLSSFLAAGARLHGAADKGTQMLASHFQTEKEAMESRERETGNSIRKILSVVAVQSQGLADSSEQLSAASRQMLGNAEETSSQATLVSGASDRIAQIVQTVATATEELNSSIQEISANASSAARTVGAAVKVAAETKQAVSRLGQSSMGIGQVVKVITSVAQQTNLLALNATIEAARAGEAGKGFAVVAHEVKELAKQTAHATDEISQKIEAIQNDTKSAISAIEQIDEIVDRLSGASNTIATAAEQQTAATREIARNLTDAATGVSEITSGVAGVADVARRTSAGAEDSLKAATGLANMAAELRTVVTSLEK